MKKSAKPTGQYIHLDFLDDGQAKFHAKCSNEQRLILILELVTGMIDSAKEDMGEVPRPLTLMALGAVAMIKMAEEAIKPTTGKEAKA